MRKSALKEILIEEGLCKAASILSGLDQLGPKYVVGPGKSEKK